MKLRIYPKSESNWDLMNQNQIWKSALMVFLLNSNNGIINFASYDQINAIENDFSGRSS